MVERFAVGAVERAALCDGTAAFLEWCDSLVESPERAHAALSIAAFAVTPTEILDRGPAFVRLRTGLLRACLRGAAWNEGAAFAAAYHAHWLATGERRSEAATALGGVEKDFEAVGAITRRYLGRAHAEELRRLGEETKDSAVAAWLFAEAALDLVERRKGGEAKALVERAKATADETGNPVESWTRRRDAVRIALRMRDWATAEAELAGDGGFRPRTDGRRQLAHAPNRRAPRPPRGEPRDRPPCGRLRRARVARRPLGVCPPCGSYAIGLRLTSYSTPTPRG